MAEEVMEQVRKQLSEIVCINSGDIMPNCGECIYFNSVSEYPCNHPDIDKILSIPEIRIQALDQSLPDIFFSADGNRQMDFNRGQEAMLKDNWVKVIPKKDR